MYCADLKPLTDRIAQERKLMQSRTEELLPAAVDEWQQHFAAVLQVRSGYKLMHHLHTHMTHPAPIVWLACWML